MAEIEANEYVRTADGKIGKIVKYENFEYHIKIDKDDTWKCAKDYIVKHSKQLIDLIEVGDIVEIFDVLHEDVIYIWSEEMLKALKEDIKNGTQIRKILTKEQMEANCYKVGGKNNEFKRSN